MTHFHFMTHFRFMTHYRSMTHFRYDSLLVTGWLGIPEMRSVHHRHPVNQMFLDHFDGHYRSFISIV